MDQETQQYLKVLEFPEDRLPKMKELRKRFCELSLIRHPDKRTGTEEAFKELHNAYDNLGKLIEDTSNIDLEDTEEDEAKKAFNNLNVEKVNKASVTIKISTAHVNTWELVFTEKYGNPVDVSIIKATKQWSVPYKLSEESFGVIKVKIWNLVKKENKLGLSSAKLRNRQFSVLTLLESKIGAVVLLFQILFFFRVVLVCFS